MALPVDNTGGQNTTTNITPGKPARTFGTTYTSARKFFSSSQVQNPDTNDLSMTSNSEHIIDQAGTLDSTSQAALPTAAAAAAALTATRAAIAAVPSVPTTSKTAPISFTTDDVTNAQTAASSALLSAIGPTTARITKSVPNLVKNSANTFLPPNVQPTTPTAANTNVPDIDSISVEMNSKKGSVTCFYSKLVFSLPRPAVAAGDIAAIRIFRSEVINPAISRALPKISFHGVDRIQSKYLRSRVKNEAAQTDQVQSALDRGNVDNSLSSLIPVDPLRNIRTAANVTAKTLQLVPPASPMPTGDNVAAANLSPFVFPDGLLQLDRSVATDINTLRNIQVQNPFLFTQAPKSQVQVGGNLVTDNDTGHEQIRQANAAQGTGTPNVRNQANVANFREIAVLMPSKLQSTTTTNYVTFTYEDQNVTFGRAYQYYVTTVDENMQESTRSQLVGQVIEGLRVPQAPTMVSANVIDDWASLGIKVDDQLVEKFEIYRREVDNVSPVSSFSFRSVSGVNGYTSEATGSLIGPNGFLQIGESLNAPGRGSSTFYDMSVRVGRTYTYRVYSVDIFGNKSEAPKEASIFIPEPSVLQIQLTKPSLLSEVDAQTGLMRLTFACNDSRVVALFLARRDLTIGQSAFLPPTEPEHIKQGIGDAARGTSRRDDPHINDLIGTFLWPQSGYFQNYQQDIVFIDRTVITDHIYQYQVYGVDRYGNATPYVNSDRTAVVNRPFVNPPVELTSSIEFNSDGSVSGIHVFWKDGNTQYSVEDLVGPQIAAGGFQDRAIRNLFQLQRKQTGDEVWRDYPLITGSNFFDAAANAGLAPANNRPSYIVPNNAYSYRVQTFQTGAYISNFCPSIDVFVARPILAPINFRLKMNDSKARPFYVMLNWDNDPASGPIDQWEIQRAECNNVAAARLNLRNPTDFQNLVYQTFRTVYAESNQFQAASALAISAQLASSGSISENTTLIGQNCYMDTAVAFGNSYFYRIRSISPVGDVSDWTYRGAKVTDAAFEKKFNSIITDTERQTLSQNFVPVVLKSNMLVSPDSLPQGSFSFTTDSAKSIQTPAVQLTNPAVSLAATPPPTTTPPSPQTNIFVNRTFRPTNDPNALAGAITPITPATLASLT
ncbi:MAG: hypothetical protein ACYDHY_07555 [Acidiferrobacterales bacterium]